MNLNKTLFFTSINVDINTFLKNTDKNIENIVKLENYELEIREPYGCMMRNIIAAVYKENIKEIIVILNEQYKNEKFERKDLRQNMLNAGIEDHVIKTIEYINGFSSLDHWLKTNSNLKDIVTNNVNLIKQHPLLPRHISVSGYYFDHTDGLYKTCNKVLA